MRIMAHHHHQSSSSAYNMASNSESVEAELKKMVVTFRVHELQHLLGFANKNKNGKKTELLNRALDLIKTTRNFAVQQKVRELFRRRFPEQRYQGEHSGGEDFYLPQGVSPPPYNGSSNAASANAVAAAAAAFLNIAHHSNYGKNDANIIPDSHPNVKLIGLPFYDLNSTLVRPTLLRCLSAQKFQENYVAFHLTTQQLQDLTYADNKPLPRFEVQLRFCLMDLTNEQKDDFPSGIEVRMNDKLVQLPNLIPTNKPGVEPKRPSRPVNITPYCKTTNPQRIYVHWAADASKNYVVGVYFVKRISSETLLKRLKDKGLNPSQRSKQMIKSNLASDNEIATTSLRVSLQCPLGKMRMQIPCRLQQCRHLQCFDAELFLRMNEKKPTWVCPVCDKATPFDDLIIDGYFTEVLSNADKDVADIELLENGEWIPVDNDNSSANDSDSSSRCDSRSTKNGRADDSVVACVSPNEPKKSLLSSPNRAKNSNSTIPAAKSSSVTAPPTEVVIDLTESDDEDSGARAPSAAVSMVTASSSASSRQRNSCHAASCSASPSGSIILLDSPPSRQTSSGGNVNNRATTPDDHLENFLRASMNNTNSCVSPPYNDLNAAATSPPKGFSSPPKKRFKAVSPCVSTPTASCGGGENLQLNSLLSVPSPLDYSSPFANLYRRANNNNSGVNTQHRINNSPSIYGGYSNYVHPPGSPYALNSTINGGTSSSSSTTPDLLIPPHSAPILNHSAFFPHPVNSPSNNPPPPLHFGPATGQFNYLNMLGGYQQPMSQGHATTTSSFQSITTDNPFTTSSSRHYGDNAGPALNVNDYLPFLDSQIQEEYQRFLQNCVPDGNNGLS